MHKIAIWFLVCIFLALLFGIWFPGSRPVPSSPFKHQMSVMQQICKKLRDYDFGRTNIKPENTPSLNLSDHVALGVLSAEDSAYIRDHNIKFFGFDPKKIGGDIPVLETTYIRGQIPKRIVGYSDASVVEYDLPKTQ